MEEVRKTSVSSETEIAPKTGEDSDKENPQKPDADATVSIERYKELEAFATRSRQNEIAFATKAAKADPKSLLEIQDAKVQSAAVKEIYGLDTLAQVQEVFGKDFWKAREKDGDDNEDGSGRSKLSELETKIKLMEVKNQSERVENAIKSLKASNPNLISSEKDEELLRSEMKLISTELAPEDRVAKAARLAFGDLESKKAKELILMQNSAAGSGTASQDKNNVGGLSELKSFLSDAINPYKKK